MAAFLLGFGSACENDGGGISTDVGDNDVNVVVAMGDSITGGGNEPGVVPWPALLGGKIGKTVVNAGQGGARSDSAPARAPGLLARYQPGYVVLMYGANDAGRDWDTADTIANLRAAIQIIKANQSIPILCTLTPVFGPHRGFEGGVDSRNAAIRDLASEEKVPRADVADAFGED